MDGAAITITVMTLAAANTLGIHVDFLSGIVLSILATPGSLRCIRRGRRIPVTDPYGMFVVWNFQRHCHADRRCRLHHRCHQDSVETALNSSSDLLLSASAEFGSETGRQKEIKY